MGTNYISDQDKERYAHYANRDYVNIAKSIGSTRAYVRGVLLGDDTCTGTKAQLVLIEAKKYLKTHPKPKK